MDKFESLGKIAAVEKLFDGTPFKPFEDNCFIPDAKDICVNATKIFLEGMDFNLEFFPLKHLGYKCVIGVTGELYASLASPRILNAVIAVSSKLDFSHIREVWDGIVTAAVEHGYEKVSLDLVPSLTGLCISLGAVGTCPTLTDKRRSKANSKDLICVTDNLGSAYMGQQVLEKRLDLEKHKQLVAAYLKPETSPVMLKELEDAGIYPSHVYFVNRGLSDAVKRLVRDSGLGAKIYSAMIPFAGNTFDTAKELDIDPVAAAMGGGDDYCFLLTIPIGQHDKFRHDFQTWDVIGHLALPEVGSVIVAPDGMEFPIKARGWE